jgi:hypothetical protein
MEKIREQVTEYLDAWSGGYEHIDESVGQIVIGLLREAYNQGKKDQEHQHNNEDREYRSVYKKRTFNQWIKKRFQLDEQP